MNKSLSKPINILIIDDLKGYVDALKIKAQSHRIILRHVMSLEEAKEYLSTSKGRLIAGLILDVVCMKTREQKLPDESFITDALRYFETEYTGLPKAVLTGEQKLYASLKDLFKGNYKVFDKSADEESLFEYLIDSALEMDVIRFSQDYPDIYEIFEKNYMDTLVLDSIITIQRDAGSSNDVKIRQTLTTIRSVLEEILKHLNRLDPDLVPTEAIEDRKIISTSIRHLLENDHIEQYGIIRHLMYSVKDIGSEFGAHAPITKPLYGPSRYTVQSLFLALLDILLWFKGICASKNRPLSEIY